MIFISWNIDSLNAALTGTSRRALLSRDVLETIIEHDPEVIALQETKLPSSGPTKKHQQILSDMFPDYEIVWNSSVEPARKGYAGTMFLYKNYLSPTVTFPKIGAPDTMDYEGRIITLEFENFYLTQVYTPN
ncbi:MAG: exodeoxyribonuclease, partial [Tissierellia bacterium]|nr:exodeoxyribonuclease [Tissierellia bacterium]